MAQYNARAWMEGGEDDTIWSKLLQLDMHRCNVCHNTLRMPVMTDSEDGRNYCFDCKTGPKLLRNEVLEEVLQKLSIPCEYQKNGCSQNVPYSSWAAHEAVCTKRQFDCPLKQSEDCTWEGCLSSMMDHCIAAHKENIIETTGYVTLDVEDGLQEVLVTMKSNVFLVRLEHKESETFCMVYVLGDAEQTENISFVIINDCEKESQNVLPLEKFDRKLDPATSYLVENPNKNAIQLKILSPKFDQDLNPKLLRHLECPVCKHFMHTPIYQCLAGHSVCKYCKPALTTCPVCRGNFGNTRNYSLEDLLSGVPLPCLYQEKGCRKVFFGTELTAHENECALRDYPCPLFEYNNCLWEGTLTAVPIHLRDMHPNQTYNNNRIYLSFFSTSATSASKEVTCILAFGQVFRLCHPRPAVNNDLKWSLQLIGPEKDAKKFEYKIVLIDEEDQTKIAVKTSVCQKATKQEEVFNHAHVAVPYGVASWLEKKSKILYFCGIRQITA